jgi:hypothetical protein
MAPVPIIVLLFVALFVERTIILVMVCQVTAVGMIFAIIPIVVVMVARIVDPDLSARFLWRCSGPDGSACHKSDRQDYPADVSMCSVHVDDPPDRNSQILNFEITVGRTICFTQMQ